MADQFQIDISGSELLYSFVLKNYEFEYILFIISFTDKKDAEANIDNFLTFKIKEYV